MDRHIGRHGRAAGGQRLEDQRRVEPRQRRAADIGGNVYPAHAERGGFAHFGDGKVLGFVPGERIGGKDLGGEGPSGISTLVVPGDTPGVSLGANERKMGWNAQPTRAVIFQDARVPAANRLGDEGVGFKIAMAGLDGGRLNIAACSLGGAQAALDKALAYMKERRAFGKRLDEFQALQFRLADMATGLEASRTFLWRAAAALDRKEANATTLCAMAKRFVTDTCFDVANQALQLHGGYGYLSEFGIEKIVRDLRVHQILEGTNEIMRVIIARGLLGRT